MRLVYIHCAVFTWPGYRYVTSTDLDHAIFEPSWQLTSR